MKRTFLTGAALLLGSALAFAEMPARVFEVGISQETSAAQNAMSIQEIFVKDLVIDFTSWSQNLGDEGVKFDAESDTAFFINGNIKGIGAGFRMDTNVSGSFGCGKGLVDFLAYGNEIDKPVTTTVTANMESYLEMKCPVKFSLGGFKLCVTPDFFVPLLYLPNPTATVTATAQDDGTMKAVVDAAFTMYSIFPMEYFVDENLTFKDLNAAAAQINYGELATGVGFDVSGTLTYDWKKWLTFGAYASVPVIPGRMNHSVSGKVTCDAQVDPILDSYMNDGGFSFTANQPSVSGVTFGTDTYWVNRPMRVGGSAKFSFLNGLLSVTPTFGVAARNPFGEDFDWSQNIYPEYSLMGKADFYFGGVYLATSYEKQIFNQELGAYLNVRFAQLDLKIASSGTSFAKSLQAGGAKAVIGLTFGF